jgi:hypothetical protein
VASRKLETAPTDEKVTRLDGYTDRSDLKTFG